MFVCLTPTLVSHVQVADHSPGAGLHGHGCRHSVCLPVCHLVFVYLSNPSHLSHTQVADHNPSAGLHGHGCRHSTQHSDRSAQHHVRERQEDRPPAVRCRPHAHNNQAGEQQIGEFCMSASN